jgi:hypothetical protein
LESLAYEWNEALLNALLAERAMPDRVFLLKYEELVSHPEKIVKEICRFLDIVYTDEMLNYHESRQAQLQSREQHHRQVAKPISDNSVGRYRTAFRDSEIARLERTMYAGLSAFNYPLNHPYQKPMGAVDRYFRMSTNFAKLVFWRGWTLLKSALWGNRRAINRGKHANTKRPSHEEGMRSQASTLG